MTIPMNIPGRDYDMKDKFGGTTEQRFKARSDLKEGVSGCARIDTTYDNTVRDQVLRPRSADRGPNQIGGRSPTNYTGDEYHGEWTGFPQGYMGEPDYGNSEDNG